jgi:hypothetical protein
MKKRARVPHFRSGAKNSRLPQKLPRGGSMKWLIVAAICFVACFGVIALTNAAQANSTTPANLRKQQAVQQFLQTGGSTGSGAQTGNQVPPPTAQPEPTRQAGISNVRQGPFSTSIFTVRNFWQGPVGNTWLLAYAGARTNPDGTLGQGGIMLYQEISNHAGGFTLQRVGMFLATRPCTALTITAAQGELLTLRSASGASLTFNLQTHQFQ